MLQAGKGQASDNFINDYYMTPGARANATIELLEEIHNSESPADRIIGKYFKHRKYIGSKDRGFIASLTYNILRHKLQLEWLIEQNGFSTSPRLLILAGLCLLDKEKPFEVEHRFNGGKYSPDKLSNKEKDFLENLDSSQIHKAPLNIRSNIPAWLISYLDRSFGKNLEREIAELNKEAPLDLRINTLKSNSQEVLNIIKKEGFDAFFTPISPIGIRILERRPIFTLDVFKNGFVEVQDEGSQIVSLLVGARPGEKIVDFCAGAGGKTLSLAAQMRNKGRIYAFDVSEKRLDELKKRLKRGGVSNVQVKQIESENDQYLKRLKSEIDRVVLDVPCSGSGTWRRNPDAKYRLTREKLQDYISIQSHILDSACRLVKPGGYLFYITCSMLQDENENQIKAFLSRSRDFEIIDISELINKNIKADLKTNDNFLGLSPHKTNTDGFFIAAMKKRS